MSPLPSKLLWPFGNAGGAHSPQLFHCTETTNTQLQLCQGTHSRHPPGCLPLPPHHSASLRNSQHVCIIFLASSPGHIPSLWGFLHSCQGWAGFSGPSSKATISTPQPVDCKLAHSGGRDMGFHSSKTLPATPPLSKLPLITEHAKSHQTQLTFWLGAGMNQLESVWQHLQQSAVEPG